MSYKYTHFIKQNIAPKGANRIAVYNANGTEVASIALGGLTPPLATPLYSFGVVSDVHLDKDAFYVSWKSAEKLERALAYFKAQGCAFAVQCGDLTNYGFFHKDGSGNIWLDASEFQKFDEIRKSCGIPIHGICGNHESYGKNITDTTPITIGEETKTMLEFMYDYTGVPALSYTVEHGNDLFIFVSQPKNNVPVCGGNGEENLEWLSGILANNTDKRCFLFVHSYIEEDSGDPADKRENSIFEGWVYKTAFMNLLRRYPNVILFHGHSHMKFECQELDKKANYTEVNGFKSVHNPSLSRPRNLDLEDEDKDGQYTEYADKESQGYIVDVYEDCIVLNGMDLINNKPVPLGTYKIST